MTPEGAARRARLPIAFLPLALTYLGVALNMTIASITLPTISTDLRATAAQLMWIVNVTPMAAAALILFAGSWGDRFGRKRLLVVGLVVFLAAAVLSAASTNVVQLIVLRAATGVGSALAMPAALALTFTVVAEASRRSAVGIIASMQAVGTLLAPVLAGGLMLFLPWGAAFLSVVPFLLLALVLVWTHIPSDARRPAPGEPVDVVGATLMAVAAVALLYAAVTAGSHSSDGGAGVAALGVAAAAGTGLVLWERHCPNPVFIGSALRRRDFWVPTLVILLVQFVLGGVMFANTQYVQLALGFSAFAAGLFLVPALGSWVAATSTAGLTARRFGMRAVAAVGLATASVGLLLVALAGRTPSYAALLLGLLLLGCMGVAPALMTHQAVSSYPDDRRAIGSAINSVAMRLGLAFGVAAFGSAITTRYATTLDPSLAGLPPEQQDLADNSLGGALQVASRLTGAAAEQLATAARESFVAGFRVTLLAAAVLLAGVAILVLVAARDGARPAVRPADDVATTEA